MRTEFQTAKHAELDRLGPQIQAARSECERSYGEWSNACQKLRQLERESKLVWDALFDSIRDPQ